MSNIIKWDGFVNNKIRLEADSMLTEIAKSKPDNAFVLCWSDDGDAEVSYHCNSGGIAAIITELERFKHKYFEGDFE